MSLMPKKPKKPCSYPGCPNLTDNKYCDVHAPKEAAEKTSASRKYEREARGAGHEKFYGTSWRKVRKAYAQAHPLCERCLKDKKYVKVEEVHHIIPVREGGTNDPDNLMSLCRKCHAQIHEEMGTRKNPAVYRYEKW